MACSLGREPQVYGLVKSEPQRGGAEFSSAPLGLEI